MQRSNETHQAETPTSVHIAVCFLIMAAGLSTLYLAWPTLVELVPPQHQVTAERSWYALRSAVPALAGLLCLPFIARHRRRPAALAVGGACFMIAGIASAMELQRVDGQRGNLVMREALKQSDKFVWYGAGFA